MRFNMYATIALFVGIMIVAYFVSAMHPVHSVRVEHGAVLPDGK